MKIPFLRYLQWVGRMRVSRIPDFPLPSTGRGIEGEGWEYRKVRNGEMVGEMCRRRSLFATDR
jgi:hypothetical protein